MTKELETGDYDLRGISIEQLFALRRLPDICIDAANRAGRSVGGYFPGWQFYSRIVRGDTLWDNTLYAWGMFTARALSRSKLSSGQPYMKPSTRGRWVAYAGALAVRDFIHGYEPAPVTQATALGAPNYHTYSRIYVPVRGGMALGVAAYQNALREHMRKLVRTYRKTDTVVLENE